MLRDPGVLDPRLVKAPIARMDPTTATTTTTITIIAMSLVLDLAGGRPNGSSYGTGYAGYAGATCCDGCNGCWGGCGSCCGCVTMSLPQEGQNFASSATGFPQCGQDLVPALNVSY